MDKKREYLERAKEKQRQKYFSQENIQKRKDKALQYQKNARQKRQGLKKFSDKMVTLHEKDAIFYQKIWESRKHNCENCGKFLGNNFRDIKNKIIVYRYAHIIPKSIYPYLRHYDKNIMLLCLHCHTQFDNSPKEIVKKMKCYDEQHIEYLKNLHKELEENNNEIYK